MANTYVALLRGINVGGRHTLPMRSLIAMFEDAGASHVRTFIQSGNVLFQAPAGRTQSIVATVEARIVADAGFASPVVVRSLPQLRALVTHNPYVQPAFCKTLGRTPDPTKELVVVFLKDRPAPSLVATLDPARSPGDTYLVHDAHIFMWVTTSIAKTRLTNAYFDSKLKTVSTARNWNTVLKLIELGAMPET